MTAHRRRPEGGWLAQLAAAALAGAAAQKAAQRSLS